MQTGQLPKDFAVRMASFRQAAKMKQADLAKSVNVDGSTISRYESGDLVPSQSDAEALLAAIATDDARGYAEYIGQGWRWLPRPEYNHPDRNILWTAELALQQSASIRESSGSERARLQAELLESSLKREAAYLEDLAHDIAFVGIIAVGKTTALSVATGLMLPPAPGERRIRRTVLEVAGGNTTICEVVIVHDDDRWGVTILPHSEEEIAVDISDLCNGALAAAGEAPLDGEQRGVPKEIDRALRNMVALPKRQTKTPEGKRVTVDPLIEMAQGRKPDVVASEVFNQLKLWQRTRTGLWYDPSCGEEPARWIKSMFSKVNNGHLEDASLPKQITVFAPLRALSEAQYKLRVIDTKGIDEPLADRPDLRSYLENPRTIPVLCSGFVNAPDQSIMQLLNNLAETGQEPSAGHRMTVLLLPKNDEALEVRHDSGEVPESAEEGYEIRADKVRDVLRRSGRDGLPIITYNADSDDPSMLTEALLARIESVRAVHAESIRETVTAIQTLADGVRQAEIAGTYKRVYDQFREAAAPSTALSPSGGRPFERLIAALTTLHPRTVWATVMRQGNWGNLDVYHYLGTGVALDCKERSRVQVLEFEAAIGRMLADDEFAGVHGFLREAMKNIQYWRDEFLTNAGRLGKDAFRPALRETLTLWSACADEYGRGYGFRERVARHFRAWFEHPDQNRIFELVEASLAEQWADTFINNVDRLITSVRPNVAETGA